MTTPPLSAPALDRTGLRWRQIALPTDPDRIRDLVHATGVFTDEEVQVARQLVQTTVEETEPYRFLFAERHGEIVGYTCFDRILLSDLSFDLFWIAVAPAAKGTGLALDLMARTAAIVRRKNGRFIFAETSSTEPYAPARAFYRKAGFEEAAVFTDFYREGDSKVIYRLVL